MVNGPEDAPFDWRQVDWRRVEDDVRRLRQRIFTASKAGDLARVRNLQKLMLRSRANTLVSVRRVTERNAGRLTAGVDGEVVLTPEAKSKIGRRDRAQRRAVQGPSRQARVHPQAGQQHQAPSARNSRDPRSGATRHGSSARWSPSGRRRFEPKSYGFRPGRGCHDAIDAIYQVVKGSSPKRQWALDADLASAFDRIAHDHILAMLGTFPARGMVAQWLKAGVVEQGRLHRTEDGVPQGGVVSPVLLNVALHGMEQAAGVRYDPTGCGGGRTPRCWSGMPTTSSRSATPGSTRSRSRHGSPAGWRPGAWPSTRTRRASSPSMTGRVEPGRGAGVAAGPFPRPALRTRRAYSYAPGSPQDTRCPIVTLAFRQRLIPAEWWLVLSGGPPTARGSGDRDSDIGSPGPRRATRASCLHGWSSCAPSTVA